MNSAPSTSPIRSAARRARPARDRLAVVPEREGDSGRAMAWRRTASRQWASSVASVFRNLRRAGVLKKSSRTSMLVPTARAEGSSSPLRASSRVPCVASAVRLVTVTSATEAIAASASPRKPSVATPSSSARLAILLVAWRRSASGSSAAAMPWPSSSTAIERVPPCVRRTTMLARAGVDGVVEQLANHRRRPLDHLAGGDLADQLAGQLADRPAQAGLDHGIHRRIVERRTGSAPGLRQRVGSAARAHAARPAWSC